MDSEIQRLRQARKQAEAKIEEMEKGIEALTAAGVHLTRARNEAQAQATALREVLKAVEWKALDIEDDWVCPECWMKEKDGHAPDCQLAAAIKPKEEKK